MTRFIIAFLFLSGFLHASDCIYEDLFNQAKVFHKSCFFINDEKNHQEEMSKASSRFIDLLTSVDPNKIEKEKDKATVFKSLLYAHKDYLMHEVLPSLKDGVSHEHYISWRLLCSARGILFNVKPRDYEELIQLTLFKHHDEDIKKENVEKLIPLCALTMVQHASHYQTGAHLGGYDREETIKALKKEKEKNNAVYLLLGRGNKQAAPDNQKTPDGRDIIWVYLNRNGATHSPLEPVHDLRIFC